MKYLQILDTDFSDYMVIYSCQEFAEFEDHKSGEKMTSEAAWGRRKSVTTNGSENDR